MIRHWAPTILDGYAYLWQASETSPTDLVLSSCGMNNYLAGLELIMQQLVDWHMHGGQYLVSAAPCFRSGNEETLMTSPMGSPNDESNQIYHSCQLIQTYTALSDQPKCELLTDFVSRLRRT